MDVPGHDADRPAPPPVAPRRQGTGVLVDRDTALGIAAMVERAYGADDPVACELRRLADRLGGASSLVDLPADVVALLDLR